MVIDLPVGHTMEKMKRRRRVMKGTLTDHQRIWRSPPALWLRVDADGRRRRTTKMRPSLG